jgi:hypothetical protein
MRKRFQVRTLAVTAVVATSWAQNPNRFQRPGGNGNGNGNGQPQPPAAAPLPNDDRLMALHRRFVQDAEKLAAEYEQKKQLDKAAAVYREMLKLVPAYKSAQESLNKIETIEANTNQISVSIEAKDWWQDTGIRLIEGKPIKMAAQGTWNLKLQHDLGPEGIDMEKLPKGCNLGELIGVIVQPGDDPKKMKPFAIGSKHSMVADRAGALWVAMCDFDHKDNSGHIVLTCVGRFEVAK